MGREIWYGWMIFLLLLSKSFFIFILTSHARRFSHVKHNWKWVYSKHVINERFGKSLFIEVKHVQTRLICFVNQNVHHNHHIINIFIQKRMLKCFKLHWKALSEIQPKFLDGVPKKTRTIRHTMHLNVYLLYQLLLHSFLHIMC